jgi:hypothetical protein
VAGAAPAASNAGASTAAAAPPWWESDARFADRFQPVDDTAE